MKASELKTKIQEAYAKHFPDSLCVVKFSTSMYRCIWVDCYIAGKPAEFPHGISHNDMLNISFRIENKQGTEMPEGFGENSTLPEIMQISNKCNSYLLKPPVGSYLCYDRRKISHRKVDGGWIKMLDNLNKFFIKLKASLLNDLTADCIHKDHVELLKTKLGRK